MHWLRALALATFALAAVGCQPRDAGGGCQCECVCKYGPSTGGSAAASAPAPAAAAPVAAVPASAPAPVDSGSPGDKIVIGHIGAMSGSQSSYGETTDRGIRLAVDEQNRKGGVKGKQIVLKTIDDKSDAKGSAAAANQLIAQDHVKVILGPETSGRSMAVGPIADAGQVPMLSNTATNPDVTKDGGRTRPYVFRVCFIDPFQGTVMAKFARDVLKIYQVAVLKQSDEPYSVGLASFFVSKFKEMGGGIVAEDSYKAGDKDFTRQLTAIKAKNPEAIYVPGFKDEVPLIARKARELGIKAPLLGGDGWDAPELYKNAQGALDGSYWSNHYSEQDPDQVIQDFVKKYKATYGGEIPSAFAVLGYDAARVAFDAMERAKDLSGPAIREAIEQTRGFRAVSGVVTLDADHNAVKPAVILSIDKGASYYAATITP
jgi:branched-chain amino acid transport system substrate-binding protein